MLIVIIILYFVGREITLLICLSLCNGSWNRIKTKVKAKNILERVTLSYLLKAKTQHTTIIRFGFTFVNVETINTTICVIFYLHDFKNYLLIWGIIWLLHFSVFTFMFRKAAKK
jgi:hypothetical protein